MEEFRTIVSFPAILLSVLEMTSNEFACLLESNRNVPLREPDPFLKQGGDWNVTIQAKGKKQLADTDTDDDKDEEDEEETLEDERSKPKRRKVLTFPVISYICSRI